MKHLRKVLASRLPVNPPTCALPLVIPRYGRRRGRRSDNAKRESGGRKMITCGGSAANYRVIGRDFPTWYERATVAECYAAIGWYQVALMETDALLHEARNAYRLGLQTRLEAFRHKLLDERQLWLAALGCDGLGYAVPRTSPNRFAVGTSSEAGR